MNAKTKAKSTTKSRLVTKSKPAKTTELVSRETTEVAPSNEAATMLSMAVEKGADLETLKQLITMKKDCEKTEAEKAYVVAMYNFKAEPPEILKNSHVSYENKSGDKTSYKHASLDYICQQVSPCLSDNGLFHRWDVEQKEGGLIKVTCIIQHALGHQEKVPMQSLPDGSGGKNSIQAIGSTITYMQRYTLMSALGLAAATDDDGQGLETNDELISEDDAMDIVFEAKEKGIPLEKITKAYGIENIKDLPLSFLDQVKKQIEKTTAPIKE